MRAGPCVTVSSVQLFPKSAFSDFDMFSPFKFAAVSYAQQNRACNQPKPEPKRLERHADTRVIDDPVIFFIHKSSVLRSISIRPGLGVNVSLRFVNERGCAAHTLKAVEYWPHDVHRPINGFHAITQRMRASSGRR